MSRHCRPSLPPTIPGYFPSTIRFTQAEQSYFGTTNETLAGSTIRTDLTLLWFAGRNSRRFGIDCWFVGSDTLRGIRSSYIPMAPNTALVFLILGILVATFNEKSEKTLFLIKAGAILTTSLAVARLSEYLIGVDLSIDQLFFRFPAESLGLAPVGKMAFFTASTFFLLGLALFAVALPKHRWANDTAKTISIIVAFIGLAFSLGYLYGAPLLYGGRSIPMALNTAIGFLVCGVGVWIRGSIRDITERRFAKKALEQAHDELEARVNERTSELAEAVASLEAEIAERKQAEQSLRETEDQLRQSQKLEAVGQLAGGIAHDFNNLLTVITGYSSLILQRLPDDDPLRPQLAEVEKAGFRASSLTRQLLAFSRKQVLQPKVFDLGSLVADLSKMLRRLVGENIELNTVLRNGAGRVYADPGQVEQVLMNLVVNARDAMPIGGKLTIEVEDVELSEEYAGMHITVKPGQYLMLAVSDTGLGMDSETKKRIFEPFFTTKEVGKGTGLGLSTVYGIVKQSGGNIWVYSEVGKGTTFKIYLPVVESKAESIKVTAKHSKLPQGSENILLVEDEAMVRTLARTILEELGYRVLEATNGEEAVRIFESQREPIHLILTDVVMPLMGGKELADRIGSIKPETRVLYMSGYTDDAIVHHGVLDPGTAFLEKPFSPNSLAHKVREVLESRRD